MNNFGVIEIASTKTTHAPGWAYVPDTGINPSPALPSNRKRARNQPGAGPLSLSDATARQEAKVRKELELLDRDNQRDVNIPIPPRAAGAAGRGELCPPPPPLLLPDRNLSWSKQPAVDLFEYSVEQTHS